MASQTLLMSRGGLRTRVETTNPVLEKDLKDGQVLLRIDRFALTANVVSYAMAGEAVGYYDFFPVEEPANKAEFGRVPTWGTCTVVASRCAFVPNGQRVYGFVPVSDHLVVTPKASKSESSWVDSAPHRQKRDIIYNTYMVLSMDPFYPGTSFEDAMILVRPLFLTAWLLREALVSLPVATLIITSASSKTGTSLAALVKMRRDIGGEAKIRIIGATSPGNVDYCRSLRYFDEVLPYGNVIKPWKNAVIVDMAGNLKWLQQMQQNLKSSLIKIISVGMTTASEADMNSIFGSEGFDVKYAKPEFFFAPKYAGEVTKKDPQALTVRVSRDWNDFIKSYPLNVRACTTISDVEAVLQDFVQGRVPGNVSYVGSLAAKSSL